MPLFNTFSLQFNYPVVVDSIGLSIDFIGVITLAFGVILSLSIYLSSFITKSKKPIPSYSYLRFNLGRTILLGLEFFVAGDIIRSIATPPTFNSVFILAIIVAIRAFLSWEFEKRTEAYNALNGNSSHRE
ncbi:MAG TPA: DUF1622 domain-containing protein [Candidatus Levybacteria bacterium]|nr:DUF1622 domain-containing protein [Candidatus Levybacteria bacterium]